VRNLSNALRADPENVAARFALLHVDRFTGGAGVAARRQRLERGLPDPEAAVIESWRVDSDAPGGWQALAALDERLAGARVLDPAYGPAVRLRVAWRLRSGDPERAQEAVGGLLRELYFRYALMASGLAIGFWLISLAIRAAFQN